jgi:hypothetical protein
VYFFSQLFSLYKNSREREREKRREAGREMAQGRQGWWGGEASGACCDLLLFFRDLLGFFDGYCVAFATQGYGAKLAV